jgi:hypothetical protein
MVGKTARVSEPDKPFHPGVVQYLRVRPEPI